ncbi:MAG TPA: PEGA domain-containing protein [candidate division Zixibacteria bacterium]|nr:PEGA domain-containing protein [candidate division Zixibacteria bacterium]
MTDATTFVLLIIIMVLSVSTAAAGESYTLTVVTDPPGALVTVKGKAIATGISPVRFEQVPEGDYKVEICLSGYATHKAEVKVGNEPLADITVKLARKTRLKGALRSMFIPGWGTAYAGHKTRGQSYFILSTASVVTFFLVEDWFQSKHDTYQDIRAKYKASRTVHEQQFWYGHLVTTQKDAYDAENVRRVTIGLVAGIYSISLLDALLFPEPAAGEQPAKRLSLKPVISSDRTGVKLAFRF